MKQAPWPAAALHSGPDLSPSRELGVQCHEMAKQLAQFTTELTFALCMGRVEPRAGGTAGAVLTL